MGGEQVQMARNRMQRWVRGRCQHGDGHRGNVCTTLEGRCSPSFYPANRGREKAKTPAQSQARGEVSPCIIKDHARLVLIAKCNEFRDT